MFFSVLKNYKSFNINLSTKSNRALNSFNGFKSQLDEISTFSI